MAGKNLSIEIGEQVTKVCCVTPHGKVGQLERDFLFLTPEGSVSDGVINDVEVLAEELKNQLARHGLGGMKDVTFVLSSGRIANREVTLPPVKDNRIQQIIEANASDYFPVDMSGYQVSYMLLERNGGENPGVRVVVIAAPTAMLETYAVLADKCGLRIAAMDYSGNSQYQLLRTIPKAGVTMYVNLDCANTVVSVLADGVMSLQRTFVYGGAGLVNAYLTSHTDENFLTALKLLRAKADAFTEEETAGILDRLIGSVERSCDYFSSTQTRSVEQIVLMGSCSHLPHVADLIANSSGVATVLLDELPAAEKPAAWADNAEEYIACVGCQLSPVNLIPVSYQDRRKKRGLQVSGSSDSLRGGILICCVCVAAALILCATAVLGYFSRQREIQSMQDRMNELSYAQTVYDTYVSYTAFADGLQVVSNTADGKNAHMVQFLEELERKMPASIVLLSATCDDTGVIMDVTVNTYEEAAVVISQMRTFASIDVVSVTSVSMQPSDTGAEKANFTISAFYAQPLEDSEATAPAAETEG